MSVKVRVRNGMEPTGGAGGASEGDLRGPSADMIEQDSGVADVVSGMLLVHEAAAPAMTVVVDAGVGYVPNTAFDSSDSDSVKFWEAVVAGTTGSRTLVIGANSSGQTRIDLVCIKLTPATVPDEEASNVAELIIVAGTPGSGAPATPAYHVKLAEVTVLNGAVSITNAKIADSRVQLTVKDDYISATFVTLTGTQTQTNKRITKRISSIASSTTPTPNSDTDDEYHVTALAAGATFGAPTGTPTSGQGLLIRVKDNGTPRTLAWNAAYRAIGVTLPTTTVTSKTIYLGCIWNAADNKWDVIAVQQEF